MPDENDKDKNDAVSNDARPSKPTRREDLFAKLTDEDWRRAATAGKIADDARDERERAALQRAFQRKLAWVDRNGEEQELAVPGSDYESPRISPNGQQVAVFSSGQIWLYDFARETLTPLTSGAGESNCLVWTPDGTRIAFCSEINGQRNIYWQLADGSGGPERLTTSEHNQVPVSFSPDGQTLAFHESYMESLPTGGRRWMLRLWTLHLGDRSARPFLTSQVNQGTPQISPDGRWLAYVSSESGPSNQVFVQPYPGPGEKVQVSTYGGWEPLWNPNGRELFFRSGHNECDLNAVDLVTQPTFTVGAPRLLFEGTYLSAPEPVPNYDVSRDGRRFLMVKRPGGEF
jgi:Tol biopolymer transport system component